MRRVLRRWPFLCIPAESKRVRPSKHCALTTRTTLNYLLVLLSSAAGSINFVGPANVAMLDGSMTPLQGAMTPLFASTMPVVWEKKTEYAGKHLTPYGYISEDRLSDNAKDPELAKSLWATSETVIADVLAK